MFELEQVCFSSHEYDTFGAYLIRITDINLRNDRVSSTTLHVCHRKGVGEEAGTFHSIHSLLASD